MDFVAHRRAQSRVFFFLAQVAIVLFSSEHAYSQAVDVRFDTYSEAMATLLNARRLETGSICAELKNTGGSFGAPTHLNLRDGQVATGNSDEFGSKFEFLGSALSKHCDFAPEGNIATGSATAGSLFSPQPVRTVSQPNLTRRRAGVRIRQTAGSENFFIGSELEGWLFPSVDASRDLTSDTTSKYSSIFAQNTLSIGGAGTVGELRLADDVMSIFADFGHTRMERVGTDFQSGFQSNLVQGSIGVAWRVLGDTSIGLVGKMGKESVVLEPSGFIGVGDNSPMRTVLDTPLVDGDRLTYQDICGYAAGGKSEREEYGASIFAIKRFGNTGFASAELGVNRFSQVYNRSLCLINTNVNFNFGENSGNPTDEIFSGVLDGNPEGMHYNASFRAGFDGNFGQMLLSPRLGIDIDISNVKKYREKDNQSIDESGYASYPSDIKINVFSDGVGNNFTYPIAGAALLYHEQEVASIQSRIGSIIALPFPTKSGLFTPFVEFTYIHEFANDQREIKVQFAEDFRADPTIFSFKTDKPDRDFFEVGGGFDFDLTENSRLSMRGTTILGHDLVDSYSVSGAIRLRF